MPRNRAPFVHLRVKSAYSLLDGALRPKELGKLAHDNAMPAVAVADVNNLFGAYEITDALAKRGVQPIVACLLSVDLAGAPRAGHQGLRPKPPLLPLLVQNKEGYQNLSKLLSAAYLEAAPGDWAHVTADQLGERSGGLLALTGGPGGPLNELILERRMEAAETLLSRLAEMFPNRLYIELQRHGLDEERDAESTLIDLAYARDLPLVATNDVHFGTADMYEAHDALRCIADGAYVSQADRRRLTREHRFKSADEMVMQFADLPEAIENTIEIARRCAFRPKQRTPILPVFVPESGLSPAEELQSQAEVGLARRLEEHGLFAEERIYRDRLAYELAVIIGMEFPGYFLIVSDFMKWTRAQGIPVGVRGSGATSLVAWALDITNLDPIRFGLLFERFLNPERVSMPDFDIDFCQERRDEVVRYVRDKYGADRVAQIIALGSLQARAAVRDVGRVLQVPLSVVDRMAKLIPNPPGHPVTLRDALETEPRLQQLLEQEPDAGRIFAIAERIEGLYRHTTTHPAGVVIGDRPLDEIVPLYRDPRAEMPVTQFDCEDAEKAGLVKFDFLGLKTLTVIAKAEELLKRRGIDLHTQSIDFGDARTFEMLARGESIGVFQLEGQGMRDLLRKMRPDHINDLVALVALYRPGPMDSIPRYIAVKSGKEAPEYLHPLLEPILQETYGVMTYQEDVMSIARELAGYSLGEADLLRRAMGKKIISEMAEHRQRFVKGAGENGVLPSIANQIFEQAAKFAGYGFNKGHAAAYAQVAYQTAFLKANYPVEFLAASMTLDIGNTDRLNIFKQEASRLGIEVVPPDVNRSDAVFGCDAEISVIYYALAAVKGVGHQAMEHLVEMRTQEGPFRSIADCARRIDSKLVNRRAFESLARAGAFDRLSPNRRQLVESADVILGDAARTTRERESGQVSLFCDVDQTAVELRLNDVEEWTAPERLIEEFSAIGFYLSAHPLDGYKTALARLQVQPFSQVLEDRRASFQTLLAGTVLKKSERRGRSGDRYAFVSFSDTTGVFEAMFFPEVLAASRPLLEAGKAILLKATVTWEGEELRLRALSVSDLEKAVADVGEGLRIFMQEPASLNGLAGLLRQPGKGIVTIVVPARNGQEVEIKLAHRHRVSPSLCSAINALPGVVAVESI